MKTPIYKCYENSPNNYYFTWERVQGWKGVCEKKMVQRKFDVHQQLVYAKETIVSLLYALMSTQGKMTGDK